MLSGLGAKRPPAATLAQGLQEARQASRILFGPLPCALCLAHGAPHWPALWGTCCRHQRARQFSFSPNASCDHCRNVARCTGCRQLPGCCRSLRGCVASAAFSWSAWSRGLKRIRSLTRVILLRLDVELPGDGASVTLWRPWFHKSPFKAFDMMLNTSNTGEKR